MKKIYYKEKRASLLQLKYEDTRVLFKSIFQNQYLPYTVRWNCLLSLSQLPASSLKHRIVGRCFLSKHRKKFNFLFKFSRLVFLRLVRSGQISGLHKCVW